MPPILRHVRTAIDAAAPTVTDDAAHGYVVGDQWIDTSGPTVYTLVDSTAGAAVWLDVSSAAAGYPPVFSEAASTTTTSTTGIDTGAQFSLVAGAKYVILGWGRYHSSATGVSIRINLAASGGLTLTSTDVVLRAQNSATAEQPSYTNAIGAVTGGTAGSNVNSPWSFGGYLDVSASGTLKMQLASETGASVTLDYGVFRLERYV